MEMKKCIPHLVINKYSSEYHTRNEIDKLDNKCLFIKLINKSDE